MDRLIWKRIWRALLVLSIFIVFVLAVFYVTPLVYPFLLGWLIAYTINPIISLLHRRLRIPRWLGTSFTLLVFASAMLTIMSALVTRIVVEIISLSKTLSNNIYWWRDQIEFVMNKPEIQNLIQKLNSFYQENPNYQEPINNRISDTASLVAQTSTNIITYFLNGIVTVITSLPNAATIAVVVLLAAFFIGNDWPRLSKRTSAWLPEAIMKSSYAVLGDLRKALFGYVRAQFIMISITGVVVTIGLIIIGVNYAITIGLLIGLVDLLPYLGVGAAMIPWILYTFIYGDVSLGIGLSILYGVILIARQTIEPKVLASSVGLEALPTLIALFVGLKLFGVLGLIIGPVSLVILTAIHKANVFRDLYSFIVRGPK